jgi:Ca-activated chloride channel family protein
MFKKLCLSVRRHTVRTVVLLAPFIVLIVLNLVNPLLRESSEATYCPTPPPPTVLEENLGMFPSPVTEWQGYVIWLVVFYVLGFIFVRLKRGIIAVEEKCPGQPGQPHGSSSLRLLAPFLLSVLLLVALSFIVGVIEAFWGEQYYYYSPLQMVIENVIDILNTYTVPVLLVLGLIQFIWGAFLYLIPGLDGNKLARRKGRIYMSFAFLLGFLIVVFWGIINLLASSTGLSDDMVMNVPSVGVGGGGIASAPRFDMAESVATKNTMGFAVGGAKDADNFRENIEQCYLPIPTDITYEGLFYDYIFDTSNQSGCTALFCPQYEGAVVADPFSGEDEYFLSVGLGSNIDADTFKRMPLDVVVVLDISGSMSSSFNRYYYDQFRDPSQKPKDADWDTSKMEIAKEAIGAMVDRLEPDDRFGLVVFDSTAEERLTIERMGQNGYATAKNAIYPLQPRGGTNMEAGLEAGTRLMKRFVPEDGVDREQRIIFLTDAMPNTGAIEQNELYTIGKRNAEEGIHTTYIGIGVDFNTELVEALSKEIKGANYYAIHSSSDFERRLDIEFEYMVSPLVFDLSLQIEGGDYEIRAVYGSPEAHLATGEILKVSTLFPSPTAEGNSRGGVILAHMEKVRDTGEPTRVLATYTDRSGTTTSTAEVVAWSQFAGESASANVRKAVLLSRYVNLMQNWLIDENERQGLPEKTVYVPVRPYDFYYTGLVVPAERYPEGSGVTYQPYELNYWERLSRQLVVSEDYKKLFKDFRGYMEEELEVVSESEKLKDEVQLLKNLENSPNSEFDPEEDVKEGVEGITRERE